MYGSVSDGVLDLATAPEQTAHDLYTAIRDLFQANQEPRVVILNQEFSSSTQGDLPVEAYASQLKQTADALRDVGHAVEDRQLVLNLLNGLNQRLANTADIIANTTPLLSFTSAVNMLRLKELRLASETKATPNTALAASTIAACTSASCRSSSSSSSSQPRGGGKGKGKGNKGGGGSGGRKQQQSGQGSQGGARPGFQPGPGVQPAGPWVCYNPWVWGPSSSSNGAHLWRRFLRHILPSRHRRFRRRRRRPSPTLHREDGIRRVSLPP
jgi:hypothetical protein